MNKPFVAQPARFEKFSVIRFDSYLTKVSIVT